MTTYRPKAETGAGCASLRPTSRAGNVCPRIASAAGCGHLTPTAIAEPRSRVASVGDGRDRHVPGGGGARGDRDLATDGAADAPLGMSQREFSAPFAGSPVKHAKLRGLGRKRRRRAAQRRHGGRRDVLTRALGDEEPLVREHAAWAFDRIAVRQHTSAP